MTPEIYIGVGSNIEPEKNITQGLILLLKEVKVTGCSGFYQTLPIGRPEQDHYINGVWRIQTDEPPEKLKQGILRKIEEQTGRKRELDKYAPRTLDLDLLLYGDRICRQEGLRLPDPDIVKRSFIALPLLEINPSLVLPGGEKPLAETARNIKKEGMVLLEEFTASLKRIITQHNG